MLLSINEITAIEERYTANGTPSLGYAHEALLARWQNQDAGREECLRLMFLSWYSCSEPDFLTGLPGGLHADLFRALFERLGGEQSTDSEVVFAVEVMASLSPYCCGDGEEWAGIASVLKGRYCGLQLPHSLVPGQFDQRGAYGQYFKHMLLRQFGEHDYPTLSTSTGPSRRRHFRPLSDWEGQLLAVLLGTDFSGRDALAEQVAAASVRGIDHDGSLEFAPSDSTPAEVARRVPVEAELDDNDGVTIHVLLHVVDGYLKELEVYRDDSSGVQRVLAPGDLRPIVL